MSDSPMSIGAGSFATIYGIRGMSFVFKVAHFLDRSEELRNEYLALEKLYSLCESTSFFAIPRPIACYDPATTELLCTTLPLHPTRVHDGRPIIDSRTFHPSFTTATYIMDRAHALPIPVADKICELFYPPFALEAKIESPQICRLYFGKTLAQSKHSKFLNSSNFPIDVSRYRSLLERFPGGKLASLEEVTAGMGEMLSKIHWVVGYDGRDIEFVMAGNGQNSVRNYVIDFNQMRRFDAKTTSIQLLVDSFFVNDPYYPRPKPEDSLYQTFRKAYLQACPVEHRARAWEFLDTIEAQQVVNNISNS